MADFELADAEFKRQAYILQQLIRVVEVVSAQEPDAPCVVNGAPLPLVPNGGQNTMSACAIVLLAAHFEECIRQQVEEYARCLLANYDYVDEAVRKVMADSYWRSAIAKLGRCKPKDDGWAAKAAPVLSRLQGYPTQDKVEDFIPAVVSEHEHNMRMEVLLGLSGKVGLKKVSAKMYSFSPLKKLLGAANSSAFDDLIKAKMNEFYELRNTIVHQISQNTGVGPSVVDGWIEFLVKVSESYASMMLAAAQEFQDQVAHLKAKTEAA